MSNEELTDMGMDSHEVSDVSRSSRVAIDGLPPIRAKDDSQRHGLMARPLVLVVDDDPALARVVSFNLEQEGYRVLTASNGQAAMELVRLKNPDLVLLDALLPDVSGFEVCDRIRSYSAVPIIMVTVKGNEEDIVIGMDLGADDYIAKPFDMGILLARVKRVMRRSKVLPKPKRAPFILGPLRIDFDSQAVFIGEAEIRLSATEYRLICLLARNAGRVLGTDYLLTQIWGAEYSADIHVLNVTISRLRKKLGDDARMAKYIVSRPGFGYMLKKTGQEILPRSATGFPLVPWRHETHLSSLR